MAAYEDDPANLKDYAEAAAEESANRNDYAEASPGNNDSFVPSTESKNSEAKKASDPKEMFNIDDGVDRDAEWTKFEKDEAKRKADQKAKDAADVSAEKQIREETKEKVCIKFDKHHLFWLQFMLPIFTPLQNGC